MSDNVENSLVSKQDWLDAINTKTITVAVIGIGRIGLPTALMISGKDYQTFGIDIDEVLVEKINQGGGNPPIPFVLDEPDLPELLQKVIKNKKLIATTNLQEVIPKSNIIIICVPTPVTDQKVPDYSIINSVVENLGSLKEKIKGKIIIVESTVGPKYVEFEAARILGARSGFKLNEDFWIASCPERANPGEILKNLTTIPRIVGASNDFSRDIVVNFYETIFKVEIVSVSNPRTANSVKLIENIFRAVNIAYANEIAQLMRLLDIDYMEVLKGAKTKYNFLPHYPGPGVGGPCLPSNPYYLINDGYSVSFTPNLVRIATEINQRQPSHITELIFQGLNEVGHSISGTPIAILGISYKPNVKDIQISSIIPVIESLRQFNATLSIYDPYYAGEEILGAKIMPDYKFIQHNYPMVIVHTAHAEFQTLEFKAFLKQCPMIKVILDCNNIYEPEDLPKKIHYLGVGRPIRYLK